MYANYHTHTLRCNHADGLDREYVESAIRAGFKILGFSDHTPMPFRGSYYSYFRMRMHETEDYINSINKLKEEYKNDIKIYTGFETEYYPAHFSDLLSFLSGFDYDYMILGQHFADNEVESPYVAAANRDCELLKRYYNQILEGYATGKFTYIAHPDLYNFVGDSNVYEKVIYDFCTEAKKMGAVLEINQLGLTAKRNYPNPTFWDIAAKVGNTAILGCDAHTPSSLEDKAAQEKIRQIAVSRGITLLDEIQPKRVK